MNFLILVAVLVVGFFVLVFTIDTPDSKPNVPAQSPEVIRIEKERQEALTQQKSLEDKYFNSPVTRQIIEAISDGTGQLPEEITIYDDHVTGCTNGQMKTFGFAANRVPVFESACFISRDCRQLLLGPKVALGNAINRILHEQYEVHDDHRLDDTYHHDDNHEWVPVIRYISDHVLLRLKATNQW